MSWRWRKSIGRGPIRISMSRKGVGWSVGIPGLRYGRSPDGRKYISQGIPGTGLYRIRYLGGRTSAQPAGQQGQPPVVFPQPPVPPVARPPIGRPPVAPKPPLAAPGPRNVPAPGPRGIAGAITRFLDRLF